MGAHLFNLDVIANNLANAGTTAFKRSRTNFEDQFYEHFKLPGTLDSQGTLTPVGTAVGLGTRVAATAVDHRTGNLLETGGQLDLAIMGEGFFRVQGTGEILYTRAGAFSLNANGEMVMQSADRGRLLDPPIVIPPNALEVSISSEGFVTIREPGNQQFTQVGQIQLARFVNPQGLMQMGDNLFAETEASGVAFPGTPGLDGIGTLRQNYLEVSNVEPVRELVDLIKTQRNVELNSQALQAADQMLQLVANIRRF
jgi:flagellar basal-body rod protein FlgG